MIWPTMPAPPMPALLAGRVVVHGRLKLLDILRRELRPVDSQSQLVERAIEPERDLVVLTRQVFVGRTARFASLSTEWVS